MQLLGAIYGHLIGPNPILAENSHRAGHSSRAGAVVMQEQGPKWTGRTSAGGGEGAPHMKGVGVGLLGACESLSVPPVQEDACPSWTRAQQRR
jgi:hypothetical protein